jgi:hypothetical protein
MTFPRCRLALFPLVIVVLVGAGQPPARQKDPQSAYEPRSGPGAGQKFLAKFVGDWDVVKTFHTRSGEPSRQRGTCRQTMEHDGRFLKSEFTFEQGDTKTTGTGLIGYETPNGPFSSVWIDSRQTKMSARAGKGPFDGKEIVLYSKSFGDDAKGPTRSSRTVTKLEDDGNKIVHRQFAIAVDGSERLMMELVMTRKSGGTSTK